MAIRAEGTVFEFTPKNGQSVTVGLLTSVGQIKADSEEIDVTTLDSQGVRETIRGRKDYGSVELTGFHEKDGAGQAALREAYESGEAGTVCVRFPDGTAAEFPAYVKSWSIGAAEVDGAIGFGATLRVTGKVEMGGDN